MNRSVATVYIAWSAIILVVGITIFNRVTDSKNPNSLKNRFEQLNEVMNENTEISK